MLKKLFFTVIGLFLMVGVSFAALDVPAIDQDIFTSMLGYKYICGPTVASELMAYWAKNGYPDLMDGKPSGEVPDVSVPMQELFLKMIKYSGYNGSYTYPDPLKAGIKKYFNDNGYDVNVTLTAKGKVYWSDIIRELNAGRPVIILAWNWNHYIIVTGYSLTPTKTLTLLWGHVPLLRTIAASNFSASSLQAIYVKPATVVPEPITPVNESWYLSAKTWCDANGWEIEIKD